MASSLRPSRAPAHGYGPRPARASSSAPSRASVLVLTASLCLAVALSGLSALAPQVARADPAPSIASVQRQLDQLAEQAEQASERYNAATDRAAAVRRVLTKVRSRVATSNRTLAAMHREVARFAADSYRSGGMDSTMALLLSDRPDDLLERASSLDRISARQSAALRRVATARAQVSQDQRAVEQQLARLRAIQRGLAADQRTIADRTARSQGLLSRLKAAERARIEAARKLAAAKAAARARAAAAALRRAQVLAAQREAVRRDASRRAAVRGTQGQLADEPADSPGPGGGDVGGADGGGSGGSYDGPASGRAAVAIATALAQVGDSYVYAADGPRSFDCSGLVSYAWRTAGVSIPRSSASEYAAGRKVDRSDLQPGDLVYYYSPIHHVAMYIGNGQIVHAANPRTGVTISSVGSMPFAGATRP